jgi:Mce-associated membrane protein
MTSLTETQEPIRRGGRGARTRILNAAAELFYLEGINATGVGRIASNAAVSKRTLYQHFPSKTALVEEYLRQLRQAAGAAQAASATSPREQLLALFDTPADTEGKHQADPADNTTDHPTAAATVEKSRDSWWPVKGRQWRRRRTNADKGCAPAHGDTHAAADLDAADLDATGTHKIGSRLIHAVSFGVVPVLAIALALGVAYLKYTDSTAQAAEQARVESLVAAKDSTVAMLSYTPDTADKDLTAARDRLTGTFRDSYSSLIHDVVIPAATQQKLSATATVPAAASIYANPDHAVVLVYVNQAITMGADAPTQTNSVVQVTLDRSGNQWLISGFDPK